MSSIPGSVGYILSYPMFILNSSLEPTITWVPSGFSGYIWLDTKIVLNNTDCNDLKSEGLCLSHGIAYMLSPKCLRNLNKKE